jgi:predicted small secreted protein
MMRKLTLCLMLPLLLAACNTVEGMGKDIRNLGGTIESSAKDNKE